MDSTDLNIFDLNLYISLEIYLTREINNKKFTNSKELKFRAHIHIKFGLRFYCADYLKTCHLFSYISTARNYKKIVSKDEDLSLVTQRMMFMCLCRVFPKYQSEVLVIY